MEQHPIALLALKAFYRTALAAQVRQFPEFQLAAELPDAAALKRYLALGKPLSLALLCCESATAQACELLQWLADRLPNCPLLVLGHDADPVHLDLFGAGARGYCPLHAEPATMRSTMLHLLGGAYSYPPATWAAIRRRLPQATAPVDLPMPSPLQCEFLVHLAAPDTPTYREIARRMGKSLPAVEQYRTKLFERYDIKAKGGLVLLAKRLGLV